MTQSTFRDKVISYGLDRLADVAPGIDAADLHNRLFNEDYFVIGTYEAKQLLEEYGTFEAIERVREYEQDNFGEVTTEVDPERIANMLAYIIGEEWLAGSGTLTNLWDNQLTEHELAAVRSELSHRFMGQGSNIRVGNSHDTGEGGLNDSAHD